MTSARILVVEHDAECPPHLFGTWLEEAGCELDRGSVVPERP